MLGVVLFRMLYGVLLGAGRVGNASRIRMEHKRITSHFMWFA